jgi:hypothetical protein
MSTLCLSDMGELRDEWLREPRTPLIDITGTPPPEVAAAAPRSPAALLPDDAAVAA